MNSFSKRFFSVAYKKNGARMGMWEVPKSSSYEKTIAETNKISKKLHMLGKYTYHPLFQHPKIANRLLETVNKGEYRRLYKIESLRRRDRAIIRDFCKKVLYLHQKYIP